MKKAPKHKFRGFYKFGAGNEIRTRDPNLGKVVLYQLSYSREVGRILREQDDTVNNHFLIFWINILICHFILTNANSDLMTNKDNI